jgi:3-phosphoinositide dependent protein kinase-1
MFYQLSVGVPPFKGANEYLTFQKILKMDYTMPQQLNPKMQTLIKQILNLDPIKRPEISDIKNSDIFRGIVWNKLSKMAAPTMAYLEPLHKYEFPKELYTHNLNDSDDDGLNSVEDIKYNDASSEKSSHDGKSKFY